jgi:hypothetical protein
MLKGKNNNYLDAKMEMEDGEVWKQGRKNGYAKHIDYRNGSL